MALPKFETTPAKGPLPLTDLGVVKKSSQRRYKANLSDVILVFNGGKRIRNPKFQERGDESLEEFWRETGLVTEDGESPIPDPKVPLNPRWENLGMDNGDAPDLVFDGRTLPESS